MMKWKTPEILLVAASIEGVGISRVMWSALGLTPFGNPVNLHSMNSTK